jgi:membrane peptidoglycan carboxypeptidase
VFCEPTAIDSVVSPTGKKLAGQQKKCTSALPAPLDAAVGYAMEGVFSSGTATAARPAGVSVLGKTGTTNSAAQTWTVGSTTRVSTAVWIGNATGFANTRAIGVPHPCIGTGDEVATLRNCVFRNTVAAIDLEYHPGGFPTAPAQYLNGNTKPLPDFAGQTVASATTQLQALGFTVTVNPNEVHSAQPEGTVDSTDPPAGTKVSSGYPITINVSDGSLAKTVPDVTGETWSQAESDIESAGFVQPTETCVAATGGSGPGGGGAGSNAGEVISTDPAAGWTGPNTTTIQVTVAEDFTHPCGF